MNRILYSIAVFCILSSACAGPSSEVLATYRGGALALTDLDGYVRSLPEAQRIVPAKLSREGWLEELLRALALERLLSASDTVQEHLASPELQIQRRWTIAEKLAAAVMLELALENPPEEDAVRSHLEARTESRPQPLYDFRHVFLRLDRLEEAEVQAIRRLAASIVRRAREGEDFAALAREYSQSSSAPDGGLLRNQRPAKLEETVRLALATLKEGDVSSVVESRTGLHIFKLERKLAPRLPSQEQLVQQARAIVNRENLVAERTAHLAELRQRFAVVTDELPWRVGRFEVSAEDLRWLLESQGIEDDRRDLVVEQLLMAEEGRRRGFLTPELETEIERQLHREAVQTAFQRRRVEYIAAIPEERLQSLYEARPAAFATLETAHLDLIFVPQGRDVFATQRRLEDEVTRLRAGASFAELARRISVGPGQEQGGDLGELSPVDWVRLGPEIYKTVAALNPGEISDPVYQTGRILTADPLTLRGGFAVLRVRAKNPPRERSFEQALDGLRAAYAQRHAAEIDLEVREQILTEADFKILRYPTPEELLL